MTTRTYQDLADSFWRGWLRVAYIASPEFAELLVHYFHRRDMDEDRHVAQARLGP